MKKMEEIGVGLLVAAVTFMGIATLIVKLIPSSLTLTGAVIACMVLLLLVPLSYYYRDSHTSKAHKVELAEQLESVRPQLEKAIKDRKEQFEGKSIEASIAQFNRLARQLNVPDFRR